MTVSCDHVVVAQLDGGVDGGMDGITAHIAQFASFSMFNIDYRNDANGKLRPECDRNMLDFIYIIFWDMVPKEKPRGLKKTKLKEKAWPRKVQDVWAKITTA